MGVTVHYFAAFREAAGLAEEAVETAAETPAALFAECAGRLGRPDEATGRLRGLLADPRYADQARARVRANYAHHLSEVAGERRAVLTAVSSLQDKPSRNER